MPTPAQDNDVLVAKSYPAINHWGSNPPTTVNLGDYYTQVEGNHRPASVSHPVNKDGFRPPTDWWHWGYTTASPAGGFAATTPDPRFHSWWEFKNAGNFGSRTSGPLRLSSAHDSNVMNHALVNALNNLKGQQFNVGVFLGEGKETVELLTNSLTSIYRGVRNFKRKAPRLWRDVKRYQTGVLPHRSFPSTEQDIQYANAVKQGKVKDGKLPLVDKIPGAWLELQYGWKPLLSDIAGACKTLKTMADKTAPIVHASAKAYDNWTEERGWQWQSTGIVVPILVDVFGKCEYNLYYEMVNAQEHLQTQLGLARPDEIAWELMPYSFVVDWFLPIGPYIGALDAPNGFRFLNGCCSVSKKGKERRGKVALPANFDVFNPKPALLEHFDFYRQVLVDPPVPGLYVKSPISTAHAANAFALLAATLER